MFPLISRLSNTTRTQASFSRLRQFSSTAAIMGVSKTILKEGDGAIPKVGDKVTIEYTGFLKDTSKPGNKGSQ